MHDGIDRHHRTGIGPAGRISNHAGSAAQKGNRTVPRHLQPLHQAQCHKMTHVKAVRGRVKPDVEGRLARIDHLADAVLIRQLSKQSACLQFFINAHIVSSLNVFLYAFFQTGFSIQTASGKIKGDAKF